MPGYSNITGMTLPWGGTQVFSGVRQATNLEYQEQVSPVGTTIAPAYALVDLSGSSAGVGSVGGAGVVYSDTFDRADSTSTASSGVGLGAGWNAPSFGITSNKAVKKSSGTDFGQFLQSTGTLDHWAEVDIGGPLGTSQYVVLNARNDTAFGSNVVMGFIRPPDAGGTAVIAQLQGGSYLDLAVGPAAPDTTGTYKLRLECQGTAYRLYHNGTLVQTYTGTIGTIGPYVGVNANDSAFGITYDNYRCGPLPYGAGGGCDLTVVSGPVQTALAGSSAGLSTVTAATAVSHSLAATSSAGTSTTTSALARAVPVATLTIAGGSTVAATTLVKAIPMVATAGGQSSVTSALTVPGSGALANTRALEAGDQRNTEAGTPRALESLVVVVALAGSSSGLSTDTATTLVAARALAGSAAGLFTESSALGVNRAVVGAVAGHSAVTAALTVAAGGPPPELPDPLDPTYTEMWTGTNGAGWGSQWTHGHGTAPTIQGNRGRQVAAGSSYDFVFDVYSHSVTDFELTISYALGAPAGEQYLGIYYRFDPTLSLGFPVKGYALVIDPFDSGSFMIFQKIDAAAASTTLASVEDSQILTTDRVNIRLKVDGFRHRVRWWKVGDPEPTTWQINVIDSTWITGNLGLGGYNGDDAVSRSIDWDDFSLIGGSFWKGVGVIRYDSTGEPVYWITSDLNDLNAGWWYGWDNLTAYYSHGAPGTMGLNYVPMQWGDWTLDDFYGGPPDAAAVGDSGTLLGFNEPDDGNQANMSVSRALALWPQLEATGLRLGSPASTPYGFTTWLSSFMTGNGGGYIPRVDFVCCHWYPNYTGGYGTIGAFLDAVHAAYPTKPIWLTEIGDLTGGPSANAALIPTVMAAVLARPWVERVGWFCQRDGDNFVGSGLISFDGVITEAGVVFAALPPVITTLGGPVALAGNSSGFSTTTTAAIAVSRTLVSSAAGVSSTTAAIARAVPVASTIAGVATTTTALIVSEALAASAVGISTTTANLIVAHPLAAGADGVSTTSAVLVVSGGGGLTAFVQGTSTTTATLSVGQPLAGTAGGVATTTAAIARGVPVAASVGGLSTTTATLVRAVSLATVVDGLSTTTAAMVVAHVFVGSSAGMAATSASFAGSVTFVGSAGGLATTTADLVRVVPLVSSIAGLSTTTATVQITRGLTASAAGLSTVTVTPSVARALGGSASGLSTNVVVLRLALALRVTVAGRSTTTGDLTSIYIAPLYGLWNGQNFEDMQYGNKQVVDWMMVPS